MIKHEKDSHKQHTSPYLSSEDIKLCIPRQSETPLCTSNDPATILNKMRGGVIICDFNPETQSSQVEYMNLGWTEITGYTCEQLIQEKCGNPQSLVLLDDKAYADAEYNAQMSVGGEYELMYRITNRNGQIRWVVDKGIVTLLQNGMFQNQSVITDVTSIKENEEALRLLAELDPLTELNNKSTFTTLVQNVLAMHCNKLHALIMLDIDNFKDVNDSFGHSTGDRVLKVLASQLKKQFPSNDVLGRIGGDEFMIFMTDISSLEVASKKSNELCESIRNLQIPRGPKITISAGVSFSSMEKGFESLFEEADIALYGAKKNGKNQVQIEYN